MLVIFVLSLISKLALVCGDCDFGTPKLNNFDWSKVGVSVFTSFLQQAADKTGAFIYISFVVP